MICCDKRGRQISDFESEGRGFESLRARSKKRISCPTSAPRMYRSGLAGALNHISFGGNTLSHHRPKNETTDCVRCGRMYADGSHTPTLWR